MLGAARALLGTLFLGLRIPFASPPRCGHEHWRTLLPRYTPSRCEHSAVCRAHPGRWEFRLAVCLECGAEGTYNPPYDRRPRDWHDPAPAETYKYAELPCPEAID